MLERDDTRSLVEIGNIKSAGMIENLKNKVGKELNSKEVKILSIEELIKINEQQIKVLQEKQLSNASKSFENFQSDEESENEEEKIKNLLHNIIKQQEIKITP